MNPEQFRQRLTEAVAYNETAEGRALTVPEAIDIAARTYAAALPKKKPSEMTDEEWQAAILAEPRFALLDVRRELAACDLWTRRTLKKLPSRARLLAWLNKAERVRAAKAAGATFANGLRPPPPVGPPGWFAWFAPEFARVGEDDPAYGQLLAAHSCRAFHMLPASWRSRALREVVADTVASQ